MKAFIVYCHPSKDSFTFEVKENFIKGLRDGGHSYELSDLYAMNFDSEFTEQEYLRETYYREEEELQADVLEEQAKIQNADAIAFIYPVFWTEAPAKLVGWFDRVWTCGFAYGKSSNMKVLDKALVIAIAGKSRQALEDTGEGKAMETVMLGDRIRNRAKEKSVVFLDGTTRWDMEIRRNKIEKHLVTAYNLGKEFGVLND